MGDPIALTLVEWDRISSQILFLFLFVLAMVSLAGSMFMAHALLPTLITTRHIPQGLGRLRRIFYATAILAAAAAVVIVWRAIENGDWVRGIYPRFWV